MCCLLPSAIILHINIVFYLHLEIFEFAEVTHIFDVDFYLQIFGSPTIDTATRLKQTFST